MRGFTSYAEANEPERAIALLNAVLAIEIDAVGGNGGDVDKMIGDALLARAYREVPALAARHAAEIDARFPKVMRRVGGYALDAFVAAVRRRL